MLYGVADLFIGDVKLELNMVSSSLEKNRRKGAT